MAGGFVGIGGGGDASCKGKENHYRNATFKGKIANFDAKIASTLGKKRERTHGTLWKYR